MTEVDQLKAEVDQLKAEVERLNALLDDAPSGVYDAVETVALLRAQRDQAIGAIVRLGHTEHCACRMAWGDGECSCSTPTRQFRVLWRRALKRLRA